MDGDRRTAYLQASESQKNTPRPMNTLMIGGPYDGCNVTTDGESELALVAAESIPIEADMEDQVIADIKLLIVRYSLYSYVIHWGDVDWLYYAYVSKDITNHSNRDMARLFWDASGDFYVERLIAEPHPLDLNVPGASRVGRHEVLMN